MMVGTAPQWPLGNKLGSVSVLSSASFLAAAGSCFSKKKKKLT